MNLSTTVSSDWTLEEVYLYRPGKAGYIVYNPADSYWDATDKHAIKAYAPGISIPDDYTQDKYKYETAASEKVSLVNTLYSFETAATNERLKTTALVVGLKKKEGGKIEYYRIDIKKDANNDPVEEFTADILRNYTYNITINSVNNDGKDDEDKAYEGYTECTIEVLINSWIPQEIPLEL